MERRAGPVAPPASSRPGPFHYPECLSSLNTGPALGQRARPETRSARTPPRWEEEQQEEEEEEQEEQQEAPCLEVLDMLDAPAGRHGNAGPLKSSSGWSGTAAISQIPGLEGRWRLWFWNRF